MLQIGQKLGRKVREELGIDVVMTRSTDAVARYLIAYGRPGADNLRLALSCGTGATASRSMQHPQSVGCRWHGACLLMRV